MVGEIFEKYRITVKKTPKKRLNADAVNSSPRRK
jgi:hypothetical protein